MKGRKAIPTKIIDLKGGTAHTHRPPRSQEPTPESRMPECPDHLDDLAKAEWGRAGKILDKIGLMTDLDMMILAAYCDAYSRWIKATRIAQKEMFQETKKGITLHPAVKIAQTAFDQMIKAGVLIGMSPASRATMKVDKKEEPKSKFEGLLNGKKTR